MNPDRYFVLGHPVAHSHSPFIHAMFAAQTGQHLHYDRRLCPLDGFAEAVRALAADSEGGRVRGCNVTVPFKHEALRLAASASDRARQAGAANVLSFDDGHWQADNTDGAGLMRDLQVHAVCTVRGQQVLLVGAGGAAAGVLGPLLESGPARVVVANRTVARAQALVQAHSRLAASHGARLESTGLDLPGQAFDIVLNASASSLSGAKTKVGCRNTGKPRASIRSQRGKNDGSDKSLPSTCVAMQTPRIPGKAAARSSSRIDIPTS